MTAEIQSSSSMGDLGKSLVLPQRKIMRVSIDEVGILERVNRLNKRSIKKSMKVDPRRMKTKVGAPQV